MVPGHALASHLTCNPAVSKYVLAITSKAAGQVKQTNILQSLHTNWVSGEKQLFFPFEWHSNTEIQNVKLR